MLEYIFQKIGSGSRFFVEIGVGPPWSPSEQRFLPAEEYGLECNTRLLAERHSWSGVLIDGSELPARFGVQKEFVTSSNINSLLRKHGTPNDFDLFSLDVDGNDYWIWKALDLQPRVVLVEYNGNLGKSESVTIEEDPAFSWGERGYTQYYGASLLAMNNLGRRKGYILVYANGVNAFFVKRQLVANQSDFEYDRLYRFLRGARPMRGDEKWVQVD